MDFEQWGIAVVDSEEEEEEVYWMDREQMQLVGTQEGQLFLVEDPSWKEMMMVELPTELVGQPCGNVVGDIHETQKCDILGRKEKKQNWRLRWKLVN